MGVHESYACRPGDTPILYLIKLIAYFVDSISIMQGIPHQVTGYNPLLEIYLTQQWYKIMHHTHTHIHASHVVYNLQMLCTVTFNVL